MTKAELGKRIGIDKGRLSRLLASPGNLTIDTLALLLAGTCGEELLPATRSPYKKAAFETYGNVAVAEGAGLNKIDAENISSGTSSSNILQFKPLPAA